MRIVRAVVIIAMLVAPAWSHADEGSADDGISEADVARFLAFFDQLVDVVIADKDSCDKMAVDLGKTIDDHTDILALINDARARGKQLPAIAQDHFRGSVARMKPGTIKCAKDDNVHAAFRRMDTVSK